MAGAVQNGSADTLMMIKDKQGASNAANLAPTIQVHTRYCRAVRNHLFLEPARCVLLNYIDWQLDDRDMYGTARAQLALGSTFAI